MPTATALLVNWSRPDFMQRAHRLTSFIVDICDEDLTTRHAGTRQSCLGRPFG